MTTTGLAAQIVAAEQRHRDLRTRDRRRAGRGVRRARDQRASRWRHFIGRLHGLQAAGSQPPANRDCALVDWKAERAVDEALPLNTLGVAYAVEGVDLLRLSGLQGQWDDTGEGLLVSHRGSIVDANWSVRARDTVANRLDLMIPQFADGTNTLVTQLDGYQFLVYGGEKACYATIDQSGDYILRAFG